MKVSWNWFVWIGFFLMSGGVFLKFLNNVVSKWNFKLNVMRLKCY